MMIRVVSLMAGNADSIYEALAHYLARATGLRVQWLGDGSWQQRQHLIETGEAEIAFVCGAVYVRTATRPRPPLHLLAAPLMAAPRYRRQPVYFSDVVVRADHPAHSFADLRGSDWVYNEPRSFSGYDIVRGHLAAQSTTDGYFGTATESGSHQQSLRRVLAGKSDATALDSIVLERELAQHPDLRSRIRIIASLGPSPIPPVVCARHVPPSIRYKLETALVLAHLDPYGQEVLRAGQIAHFVPVADADYDAIREQIARGRNVRLVAEHAFAYS